MSNPIRDRIWLRGVAPDNAVYDVTLRGTNAVTYLAGEATYSGTVTYSQTGTVIAPGTVPYPYPGSEQRTGLETFLASGGYRAAYDASAGTVVQVPDFLSGVTSPLWMYLHQRTLDRYPETSAWTRVGSSAAQQGVDITGNPNAVIVAGDSHSALWHPTLGGNGRLEFENTSSLAPGRYRLTLETGNLGNPDVDFEGFSVELNLNENRLQTTLLAGLAGFNVRGTDVLELEIVTPAVAGTWLLSLRWFNALRDAARGTQRQLVVYAYRLERLATELFRVEIDLAGTNCNVVPLFYADPNPGGWLHRYDSYGTVTAQAHEGTIYSQNDTVTDRSPLGDILTGATNSKREDITILSVGGSAGFYANGTVAYDLAVLVLPAFGALTDSLV